MAIGHHVDFGTSKEFPNDPIRTFWPFGTTAIVTGGNEGIEVSQLAGRSIGADSLAYFVDRFEIIASATIPQLDVPPAPTEPVTPIEPESASVVMLRQLLAERRAERDRGVAARTRHREFLVNLERKASEVRDKVAADDRRIVAAMEAVAAILVDIEKLGGRPEPDAI
jgi:hypothetical protein